MTAQKSTKPSPAKKDEIDGFFSQFPLFDYDRSASSPKEFYRMCDFFGWRRDSEGRYPTERLAAQEDFRLAMVASFNARFGTDANDKRSWENICVLLRIEAVPDTVRDMKDLVKSTHVNLSDLLDGSRSGASIQIFESEAALASYTVREGRFFPKEDAYAGGVLRFLLREIIGTYEGKKGRRKSGKHKRGSRSTHRS